MLRITSGTAKNINLITPDIPGYRGVQEVAKQSLFNILGDKVIDTICSDLYAGSGNLGIEALSRGARFCDFVDENKKAILAIQENLQKTDLVEKAEVIRNDAVKYVSNTPEKYDLIFVDPFYKNTSHIHLLKNLVEILNPNGIIAFFHGQELDMENTIGDTPLKIIDQRKFGKSLFTLISHLT